MAIMKIRDASLYVQVIGQGYPLLLMHGGPGLDHISLLPLRTCADRFTLIFYDHRCNGRSEGADLSTFTFENLTADAEAIRERLGFDKWAVLGHSFGGNVALEYALRYPSSLSHLILMDTAAENWWIERNAPKILRGRGYSASAVEAARRFYNGEVTLQDYIPTIMQFAGAYYYHFSSYIPAMVREMLIGPRPKMRPETNIYAYQHLVKGWTVMDRLGEIKIPVLVMAGRYDFLFPPENQAILADRLPNAQLELIERAGHNPQDERNAEVVAALNQFLSQQAGVVTGAQLTGQVSGGLKTADARR